jgi:hypothetical protein
MNIPCSTAYGLNFHLPFPCPQLPFAALGTIPDVSVVEGAVPRQLGEAAIRGEQFDAEPGRFLLRAGRRAGRFLVEDGTCITLQRSPASEDPVVAFQFLHSVMAALLHQRGNLVLHANAVLVEGGVTVLSGESGAGKSTLLAELAARGYPMLSDDVTALRLRPDGEIEVLPGPAWIHLCGDAATLLSTRLPTDVAGLPRHSWHRMKVAVPVPGVDGDGARPFRRWANLAVHPGDHLRVRSLSGTDKLSTLQASLTVPMPASEHAARFGLLHAVMNRVPILSVERPAGLWTMDQVVEAVLHA